MTPRVAKAVAARSPRDRLGAGPRPRTRRDGHPAREEDRTLGETPRRRSEETPGDAPILVVGAGPTGLALALELARRRVPVRIVDRLPAIVPLCRATALHSRTLEIFHDYGIVDAVLAESQPVRGIEHFANGERFLHVRFDAVDSPYPFTVCIEQFRTEALLEEALARHGVRVERETELTAIAERGDGVTATLRRAAGGEERVATPWLVGCDGAHSTVRHLNRQHFPGEADPCRFAVADVVVQGPIAHEEIQLFLGDHGLLFLFPLPRGRKLLIADVPESSADQPGFPALEDLRSLVNERGRAGVELAEPRWLGTFGIHYRVARHYRHGRTFLAGDAAHVHSPVSGQGMNTGIQDAQNLGWKLALAAQGRASLALLDSYERERRAVAEEMVEATRVATAHVERFRDLPASERERLYLHAVTPPAERMRGRRRDEEIDLDYRRSPLSAEPRGRGAPTPAFAGGPHAGTRAPEAGPLESEGRERTLFELLRGTQHVLLVFAGGARRTRERGHALARAVAEAYGDAIDVYRVARAGDTEGGDPAPGVACLRDPEGALHTRLGVKDAAVYLIRPDGYVGYRSAGLSRALVQRHLDRIFQPLAGARAASQA